MEQSIDEAAEWQALGSPDRNAYRVSDRVVDMRRSVRPIRSVHVAAQPQSVVFDLEKSALIVIDMQNDFCAQDGWIGSLGIDTAPARALAQPINRTTAAMRALGVPVIWVNWGVRADRLNLSPGTQHPFNPNGKQPGLAGKIAGSVRTYNVLQKDSWGAQIIDSLVQDPRDIHVDKHRISGFWDTPLNAILNNLGVKTLLFAGVNADHCVLGTLMDANFHGFDTLLLEDCTATTSPDFCLKATLHNVRFCFGFTAISSDLIEAVSSVQFQSQANFAPESAP
jgi:ureidoacrylate peracid hydrolase